MGGWVGEETYPKAFARHLDVSRLIHSASRVVFCQLEGESKAVLRWVGG